jgi:hypothetical protein
VHLAGMAKVLGLGETVCDDGTGGGKAEQTTLRLNEPHVRRRKALIYVRDRQAQSLWGRYGSEHPFRRRQPGSSSQAGPEDIKLLGLHATRVLITWAATTRLHLYLLDLAP